MPYLISVLFRLLLLLIESEQLCKDSELLLLGAHEAVNATAGIDQEVLTC